MQVNFVSRSQCLTRRRRDEMLLPMVRATVAADHVGTPQALFFRDVSQALPESRILDVRARNHFLHPGIAPTFREFERSFIHAGASRRYAQDHGKGNESRDIHNETINE